MERRYKSYVLLAVLGCLMYSAIAIAGNTHGTGSNALEGESRWGDGAEPYIVSGCAPLVPASSLTFAAFACKGYGEVSGQLIYITQASSILGPLSAGDGTYWLGIHHSTSSAVSGWTRGPGTHYLWKASSTQPAAVPGLILFARVTVAGGIITAVEDLRLLTGIWSHPGDIRRYGAIPNDDIDDSVAIQAAIDAQVANVTGVASAGFSWGVQPTFEVYFPPGKWTANAQILPKGVSLRGADSVRSLVQYDGAGPIVLIEYNVASNFAIRSLGFKIKNVSVSATLLHIKDSTYCMLDDIRLTAPGTPTVLGTNQVIGLHFEATNAALVPPRGNCRVSNLLYTSNVTSYTTNRHAVWLQANGASLENIIIDGQFNIEEAYTGIFFDGAVRSSLIGNGTIGGNETNIRMVNGDSNIIIGPRFTSPVTQHLNIDAASEDNIIINPVFFSPLTYGTDAGARTMRILSNSGNNLSQLMDTVFQSVFNTAGQTGVVDVVKAAILDKNGVVIRTDTAPTGTKALLKVERGGDGTRNLLDLDINGVSQLSMGPGGELTREKQGFVLQHGDALQAAPGAGFVRLFIFDGSDFAGTATADCALVARLSSGTTVLITVLVTDGACP